MRDALSGNGLIWRYALASRNLLHIGLLVCIFATSLQLCIPWVIASLLDKGIIARSRPSLAHSCLELVFVTTTCYICGALERAIFKEIGCRSVCSLRYDLAKHLLELPYGWAQRQSVGPLTAMFSEQALALGTFLEVILPTILSNMLRLAGTIVLLGFLYGNRALAASLVVPAFILAFSLLGPAIRREEGLYHEANSHLHSAVNESLVAFRELKAFWRYGKHLERLKRICRSAALVRVRIGYLNECLSFSYVIFWAVAALLYWIGGLNVLHGKMSIGEVAALISYMAMMQEPTAQLVAARGKLEAAKEALSRVCHFLAIGADTCAGEAIEQPIRSIELRAVTYRVYEGSHEIVRNVTLKLRRGEKLSLVGENGSGKTTIGYLFAGLLQPTSGRVSINGRCPTNPRPELQSGKIACVFQNPTIFCMTVEDNIKLGRPSATYDEVVSAARASLAHEFIIDLPKGYDTLVGEQGVTLSLGQQQRIAIARAVLLDPEVLIVDEPTSSLDSKAAMHIISSIRNANHKLCVLMISHDFSCVIDSHLIAVVDAGTVVDCGSHLELVGRSRQYRSLYEASLLTNRAND